MLAQDFAIQLAEIRKEWKSTISNPTLNITLTKSRFVTLDRASPYDGRDQRYHSWDRRIFVQAESSACQAEAASPFPHH